VDGWANESNATNTRYSWLYACIVTRIHSTCCFHSCMYLWRTVCAFNRSPSKSHTLRCFPPSLVTMNVKRYIPIGMPYLGLSKPKNRHFNACHQWAKHKTTSKFDAFSPFSNFWSPHPLRAQWESMQWLPGYDTSCATARLPILDQINDFARVQPDILVVRQLLW
jgi:hypothetical protein